MKNTAKIANVFNGGSSDVTSAVSTSWQKRAYNSLNGGVTASVLNSGKVICMEWFSKYFTPCQEIKVDRCTINCTGYIGGMETQGRSTLVIFTSVCAPKIAAVGKIKLRSLVNSLFINIHYQKLC
jgi:hypothetical protein